MALRNQQALERVLSAKLPDLTQIRAADAGATRRALTRLESLLAEPNPGDPLWQLETR